MDFARIAKAFAPIAVLALGAGLAGCSGGKISIDGEEGKKLSELDLTGAAPENLVLAGPDKVQLTQGDKLAITIDGDPAASENLRFTLKDGTLGILRSKNWKDAAPVTLHVTMPAPREMTLAGSGIIDAPGLGKDAKVTVAGSGEIRAGSVATDSLKLTVAGSGAMTAAGAVKTLDLTIAGSGSANLAGLKADSAKVTVAGSGSTAFTSDGEVAATIMGSGNVTVKGRARCKVSAMGSGTLTCESGPPVDESDKDDARDAAEKK